MILMPYKDRAKKQEHDRRRLAARRAAWFAENGPCIDCGRWDDLELDHIDPVQKVSHRIWSWSWPRIYAETAKCVVRCRSCHQLRSNQQLARPVCVHGHDTEIMGRDASRRCIACRWEREYPARNAVRNGRVA